MVRSSGVAKLDLPACEQPDELLLLAWNAGFDRKLVIRETADAAMFLFADVHSDTRTLFWPVPRPLEAVDRWTGRARPITGTGEMLRPLASAVLPGCALGALITWLFVVPHVSEDYALTAMAWIISATTAVLGAVFKILIERTLRRQAAQLDENSALQIALDQLRAGMIASPRRLPRAVVRIRRGLAVGTGADPEP
jgi:hypothetical protein